MKHKEAIIIGARDLDVLSAKNAGIDGCFYAEKDGKCEMQILQ